MYYKNEWIFSQSIFIYVPRTRGYEKKVFSPYNKAFYNLAKG